MVITAEQVKKLREATGAGMMECKVALNEAEGDFEKAGIILRKKGLAAAAKKSDRIASDGVITTYLHPGNKLGVLLELNCETDFVARLPEFQDLARDLAMHIAAMDPKYIRREDVPEEILVQEREILRERALKSDKPATIVDKIVEGQLNKYFAEVCVYEQPFVKNDKLTVGQVLTEKIATIKENINLRRFVRFKLGEGLAMRSGDFASEVVAQIR
jgi:elongation factor Ts